MPPKRRGVQPKPPPAQLPLPPLPPPPPPLPPETDAVKVRKEWSKFIDAWYEPQKKKLVERLQKDLLVKYKSLGSAKETQKLREMELFEKLDSIAQQLAQPARTEWERRLELAQLREDQWDDMSGEEQQAVMSVFVGFFTDDVEDIRLSPDLASFDEEDCIIQEHPYRGIPAYPPPPARQTIPPTPTKQTFEFVNPTSFFTDAMTPPNPTKNLPALSIDHLATLGPSVSGRSADPVSASVSASVSGTRGFQGWASEAGILTQQPLPQPVRTPSASTSAQPLSARPRAIDPISRQTSQASAASSPPLKLSSPQLSPPNPTTPPINTESLPLGKRYIGPVILEEEPEPVDEGLLKSKMADEYQQYKISLRIQMIYQFHAEAAEVEIKLFESLLADQGTKESRARVVQEHETSMMRLREQKEEERKRLCAEERERRREEMRQHMAQRRTPQTREIDSAPKLAPPKLFSDKMPAQQRPGKATHQKENIPLPQSVAAPTSKFEAPGVIKKSNSTLSQDEASANEALFANAMAMMQGKPGPAVLTPAQASLNEAVFSSVATTLLASQGQPGGNGKSAVPPPSIMKKSNSSRSQDHDVPQITVSFAEPPAVAVATPEPAPAPPTTAKAKKGKKGQPAAQLPLAKPVAITEEPQRETDAEPPPPPAPSLWDTASVVARNVWGAASAPLSDSKAKPDVSVEEDPDPDPASMTARAPSRGNANTKKPTPATKKGKKVTITEEPDVDADPIVSPPPPVKAKATKGAWGPVNGKSKAPPIVVAEEREVEPAVPLPPVTPTWGKKPAEATTKKPQLKVTISEEQESEFEANPAPTRTDKLKSATTPSAGASTSMQTGKKATQQQAMPRPGATSSGSKSVHPGIVPTSEDQWPRANAIDNPMPGALASVGIEEAEEDEEGDASSWFKPENIRYWADFMAGQPEAEAETQAVPHPTEQTGKHVRWTPTVNGESDDEGGFGDGDDELATSMWMQYAISGGDIPGLGSAPEESHATSFAIAQHDASVWEQEKGKKLNQTAGDLGNRAQQTSVFDRAALTGQWPKMESWLSPPSRGQSSGSTRVF